MGELSGWELDNYDPLEIAKRIVKVALELAVERKLAASSEAEDMAAHRAQVELLITMRDKTCFVEMLEEAYGLQADSGMM